MGAARIAVPAELFAPAESSRFQGEFALGSLEAGPDTYTFDQPVAWEVDITNTGDALLVQGTARGDATTSCARCLEDVSYALEGSIEGYFLIEGERLEREDFGDDGADGEDEDDDRLDDEFDVLPADHVIDLEPLIRAAFLVEVPGVPLCRDDCKGLCPQCGANLNDGPCGCDGGAAQRREFEEAANPFAVLKNLSFGDADDGADDDAKDAGK
ncbi:MAG: DUF177 domain-containing protein [Eggerthellaceae bacterium]|jgi:uncharacterized protein